MMRALPTAVVAVLFLSVSSAADAATTSCSTVAACLFATNTSSGYGVEGTSKANDGVVGITTQNATSASAGKAGVAGYDSSTNKKAYNSGIYGTSAYGYGVQGRSTSGVGVYGTTTTGTAVEALSTGNNATALSATAAGDGSPYQWSGTGIVALSKTGNGIVGKNETEIPFQYYTLTDGPSGITGSGYIGVTAEGHGGTSSERGAGLLAFGSGNSTAIAAITGGSDAFQAFNGSSGDAIASLDQSGNLILKGSLTTKGSPQVRIKSPTGESVVSYGSRASSATIEDFGKAVLRLGVAHVALEPKFASITDQHAGYMVFITPEGDSHGLYTTRLTASGFDVRENTGGHSSLTFSYRIVAHPADMTNSRLPASNEFPQLPKTKAFLRTANRKAWTLR